uniref:Uncharacterized protein n=1 Tax=Oryza punctata TaxID=4537 RepID=A0A0E0K3S2_ORYPU
MEALDRGVLEAAARSIFDKLMVVKTRCISSRMVPTCSRSHGEFDSLRKTIAEQQAALRCTMCVQNATTT